MRTCCHTSLAFVLKFLNCLQTFIGICMIIYSAYMLNQWNHHIPIYPPSAPSPELSDHAIFLNSDNFMVSGQNFWLNSAVSVVSGLDDGVGLRLAKLPAPWFIYLFMIVGILLCCITCIGLIAAEAISGCCLCFYTLLTTILLLLEATFVAFIAFDRHWEKDLPLDPTGELDGFRSFIEANIDICKWVGITIATIQALSLLLALILRAMVSTRKRDYDCEDDYAIEGRTREPLLNPQSSQTSGSANGDNRGTYSDIWSSRIRDKAAYKRIKRAHMHDIKLNSHIAPNQNVSTNQRF